MRTAASRLWRLRSRTLNPEFRSRCPMPGYFADRYAYELLLSPMRPTRAASPRLSKRDTRRPRHEYLSECLLPAVNLDGWTPVLHAPTGVGEFYDELRERWSSHCERVSLPMAVARLGDARALTWLEVFDASVFYPRPPVFRGATYWDSLPEFRRRRITDQHGPGSPVDFYCFMQQVHETIHLVQVGEPLLNEIVQAAIWVEFLDKSNLWDFQRRGDGSSLVREEKVVRRLDGLADLAVRTGLDTAALVDSVAPSGSYADCLAVARLFDRGQVRYSVYLDLVSNVLAGAGQPTRFST